jgi:serine-type D-Ala-D-Ala carboxypeptidase/endopeptidase (penicillin-binding protein 4)
VSHPNAPEHEAKPRRPPNLRRRARLLALFSTLTLAAAAVFVGGTHRARSLPAPDAIGPRALSAPLFTPRRLPSAFGGLLSRARFAADLSAAPIGAPGLSVCVQVREARTSEVLFSLNADRPQIPASTLKLLTGGAALEQLGPDFHFTTTAQTSARASGGVLMGPLYLVGGGDPLLSTPDFSAWQEGHRPEFLPPAPHTDLTALARAINAAGIAHVTGPIVGDASFFDAESVNPSWKQTYFDQKEIAPVTGLEVNRNLDGWQGGAAPANLHFVPDPPSSAAQALRTLLVSQGIVVDGPAISGKAPEGAQVVGSIMSPRLSDVVAYLEVASDNFVAEEVLKTLAHEKAGLGSFDAGARVVVDTLASRGVAVNGLVMLDGSGLARSDLAPCTLIADLLARAPSSPGLSELTRRLGVSGEPGYFGARFPDVSLKGKVRGKTGSLEGVSNAAGVLSTADGKGELTFAVLVSGDEGEAATSIQREVIEKSLRFPAVAVIPAGG